MRTSVHWLTADEIGRLEEVTPRRVRQKYSALSEAQNGTRHLFEREIPGRGSPRKEFNLALLDAATQTEFLKSVNRAGGGPHTSLPPAVTTTRSGGLTCALPHDPSAPAPAVATELSLFEFQNEPPDAAAVPEDRRPLAVARRRVIETVIDGSWKKLRGHTVHGVEIRTERDYCEALLRDSKVDHHSLQNWSAIENQLRVDSPGTALYVSLRSIQRWVGWFRKGRKVGGQKVKGLAALQNAPSCVKGKTRINEGHRRFLLAAYLGGDDSVTDPKLALERPRAAAACLDDLKLDIAVGDQPGPAPSLSAIKRFLRATVPASVASYAREGKSRALAQYGSWVPRTWKGVKPNQIWMADFRQTNARTWWTADGPLLRLYICAIMDVGSRDVVFLFDRYPSAELFKATLRQAIVRWGIPEHLVVDNGKEFITTEMWEGEPHQRTQRFDYDEETLSTFAELGIEPHRALPLRPTGKAPLERFFQTFDHFERVLTGATGERTEKSRRPGSAMARPERLTAEEKVHLAYGRQECADTPLLHAWELQSLLTEKIEFGYRLKGHRGDGMLGRSPAQVRASAQQIRMPRSLAALDLLLAYHQRVRPDGELVTITWRGVRLRFRAPQLAFLSQEQLDRKIEVRLDPFVADRAIALVDGRVILLESVDQPGRAPMDLKQEISRSASINKAIRKMAERGAALAPIDGPFQHVEKLRRVNQPKLKAIAAGAKTEIVPYALPKFERAAAQIAAAEQELEASKPKRRRRRRKVFTSRTEAGEAK